MKGITNREVSVEADHLLSLGFIYEGSNGNGHHNFSHPKHGATFLPATPSDWRWRKNHRTTVARQMGISLRELEDRLGIQRRRSGRVRFKTEDKQKQNFPRRIVESMRPEPKAKPAPDPVLGLPIDEQIEARVEQRQAARQSANALEAERLDRQIADLYAAKRREAA